MKAGYASADITPTQPGITLSGFASRRNRPSEGIDDPISANALIVEESGQTLLLLVFDLLGLGPEILARIHEALDGVITIPRENRILCCTHTHSAPATVKLIGCGIENPDYWEIVIQGAADAARSALESVRPARLRYAAVPVEGLSYNRRKVLEDGRVVMAQHPSEPVRREGPVWERFLLARLEDEAGDGICGLAHWAAHACTVSGMRISADYPGRVRELLSAHYGLPFMFLQGACANINPPLGDMTRDQMLRNADAVANAVDGVAWPDLARTVPFNLADTTLRLRYGPTPTLDQLREISLGMAAIADTGSGPPEAIKLLANILNVKPGDTPNPDTMRYIASLVREWSDGLIASGSGTMGGCDLSLKVWRMGELVFCFIAAEVFVETAISLQEAFPDLLVSTVGYGSPLMGYLPTDAALEEGGYEAANAFMFYGHPAPFAEGSEPAVVQRLKEMIGTDHRES